MRTGLAWFVPLLFVATATASLVESTTGGAVAYQFDGDSHHDAPGMCEAVTDEWMVKVGNTTDGLLVPREDEADHFLLRVTQEDLARRISIRVDDTSTLAGDIEVHLDVMAPFCGGSVLDAINQPPVPDEAEAGQQSVQAPLDSNDPTCGNRWFFVINGVDANTAPASIQAIWTDGYEEHIAMESSPPYPVGQYTTTSRLGTSLHSATAILPADWTGNFRLGEAPCNTTDGGYLFTEEAHRIPNGMEFSIREPGLYVVGVYYDRVDVRDPTEPVAMSCHFCTDKVEELYQKVAYTLRSEDNEQASAFA